MRAEEDFLRWEELEDLVKRKRKNGDFKEVEPIATVTELKPKSA